jgi:hypothetical protein
VFELPLESLYVIYNTKKSCWRYCASSNPHKKCVCLLKVWAWLRACVCNGILCSHIGICLYTLENKKRIKNNKIECLSGCVKCFVIFSVFGLMIFLDCLEYYNLFKHDIEDYDIRVMLFVSLLITLSYFDSFILKVGYP